MSALRPTIVILNASADTVDVLEQRLRQEGVQVVHAFLREFRLGTHDLSSFIATHDPRTVIWDLSIPYYQNWQFLETVRTTTSLLAGRGLIVTSSNPPRLRDVIGETRGTILELVGRRDDLEALAAAVRLTLKGTVAAG